MIRHNIEAIFVLVVIVALVIMYGGIGSPFTDSVPVTDDKEELNSLAETGSLAGVPEAALLGFSMTARLRHAGLLETKAAESDMSETLSFGLSMTERLRRAGLLENDSLISKTDIASTMIVESLQ